MRRARRILPAYFVVLAATIVATFFLVLPHEFRTISGDTLAAALLVPNISLWADNSYFDKATFKPLPHFWSVGVELYFYLLFPIVALCARKYPRLAAGIVSLATCFVMTSLSPKTAFFLLPFRLWELLAGVYTAKLVARDLEGRWKLERRWAGFALFATMVFVMLAPITEEQHPKWSALTVTGLSAGLMVVIIPEAAFSAWLG